MTSSFFIACSKFSNVNVWSILSESVDFFQAYEIYCSKQVKCPRISNVLWTCNTTMYHMLRCTNMYYHIIARTFVKFTPLHALYIFSDCNALNIQFWTCNRSVNKHDTDINSAYKVISVWFWDFFHSYDRCICIAGISSEENGAARIFLNVSGNLTFAEKNFNISQVLYCFFYSTVSLEPIRLLFFS